MLVEPAEAAAVARIQALKDAGMNMTMIAETMNVESPKANRRGAWKFATVKKILRRA
jgi:hypothetical protein